MAMSLIDVSTWFWIHGNLLPIHTAGSAYIARNDASIRSSNELVDDNTAEWEPKPYHQPHHGDPTDPLLSLLHVEIQFSWNRIQRQHQAPDLDLSTGRAMVNLKYPVIPARLDPLLKASISFYSLDIDSCPWYLVTSIIPWSYYQMGGREMS